MKSKKTAALLLSLTLATSALAACDKQNKTETEASETKETTEATTTVADETETTTETEPTDVTSGFTPVQIPDGTARFNAYKELATKIHNENGNVLFVFISDDSYQPGVINLSDDSLDPVIYDLQTYDPETKEMVTYICSDDGEISVKDSHTYEGDQDDYMKSIYNSYDALMKYPCMFEASFNSDSFVDTLEDGGYFGSLIAVNEDATRVIVRLGEPMILTEQEFNDLKAGDEIEVNFWGIDHLTVTAVDESLTGPERVTFDTEEIWLEQGNEYCIHENDLVFMSYSEIPLARNYKTLELEIAPDCIVVDDVFTSLVMYEGYEEDLKAFVEQSGLESPFASSTCYFSRMIDPSGAESSNGWIPLEGSLLPAIITNGQLSFMNIETR